MHIMKCYRTALPNQSRNDFVKPPLGSLINYLMKDLVWVSKEVSGHMTDHFRSFSGP